ncbi:MAG: GNAT family N-acetyltransferase [Thermosynechococcaceae cyanobacterium]
MISLTPQTDTTVRPVQYRDLAAVEALLAHEREQSHWGLFAEADQNVGVLQQWGTLLKLLRGLPNPLSHLLQTYVLEQAHRVVGAIQVSPFNHSRSTWRVSHLNVDPSVGRQEGGTKLLRHCLEKIWEARTWLVEVATGHSDHLSLYRHNGFQPLAQITYWSLQPEELQQLALHDSVLPNLLPVSNADAALLCQLDTASMPPLVRQVFDRHIQDFKTNFLTGLVTQAQCHLRRIEPVRGYVFEPQRKAAIGYFEVCLCRDGSQPHQARLTVHPAYTWLYPELLAHMAHLTQKMPPAPLSLTSTDYQSEREEYLEQVGAVRVEQTLLMSRSVWHKLRESKALSLEGLQLTDVLQGLQPNQTPAPNRLTWLKPSPRNQDGGPSRIARHPEGSKPSRPVPPSDQGPRSGCDWPDSPRC